MSGLTRSSTVQEFLDVLHRYDAVCAEPDAWIGSVCADPGAMSFGELIDLMLQDRSEQTVNADSWVVWLFTKFYSELDQDCRDDFLSALTDPMQCLLLMRWCRINLTLSEADAAVLRSKYHNMLPNAETESD